MNPGGEELLQNANRVPMPACSPCAFRCCSQLARAGFTCTDNNLICVPAHTINVLAANILQLGGRGDVDVMLESIFNPVPKLELAGKFKPDTGILSCDQPIEFFFGKSNCMVDYPKVCKMEEVYKVVLVKRLLLI
ncbi:hypothetical protein PM082_007791 [Marasmius tenuissimus]|nr:hypothetical protein PM082_007791 [Marasmius tenuissimus]